MSNHTTKVWKTPNFLRNGQTTCILSFPLFACIKIKKNLINVNYHANHFYMFHLFLPLKKLYNNTKYFRFKFQLFSIYSAAVIITLLGVIGQLRDPSTYVSLIIILALVNTLRYYLWDIVKSAYKQIKGENENVQPAGNYMMNTGTIQSSCLNLQKSGPVI